MPGVNLLYKAGCVDRWILDLAAPLPECLWYAEGQAGESQMNAAQPPETHRSTKLKTVGPGHSRVSEIKGDLIKEVTFELLPPNSFIHSSYLY